MTGIATRFPNASPSFIAANPDLFPHAKPATAKAGSPSQSPKPEPAVQDDTLDTPQGAPYYSSRCLVRVTSYRCGVQCDPDNLVAKWFVDSLRYARIISGDRPEDIDYEIRGKRVETRKEERTELEIIPL